MIEVETFRILFGAAFFVVVYLAGFWSGRRIGFHQGIATWQKSYRDMTPQDIAAHKKIIREMDCTKPTGTGE